MAIPKDKSPRPRLTAILFLALLTGASGCVGGCPGALMQGVLTDRNGDLVVVHEHGFIEEVRWSASHHSVQEDDGELVIVDWLGLVKAREGDFFSLGGGEIDNGIWGICGKFDVGEPRAS